jgi:YihY family inner membrane protein
VKRLRRALLAIDHFQQHHTATAYAFAVQKKVGDDNAGTLIANLTYTGFLTIFPLLLVLVTVLGVVAGGSSSITHRLESSVLRDFPIIGNQLISNIHALHRASVVSLAIGLLGLVWGTTGLAQTGLYTMEQVWNVPGTQRPGFVPRLGRSFAFLGVLAGSVIVSGFLATVGTSLKQGALVSVASEVVSGLCNVGWYLLGFRILTPKTVRTRQLVVGAVFGGIAWTLLEAFGSYLVSHDLKGDTAIYGFFAIVLGLIAWLYLAARIAVYAAEINAVTAYRLWPRAMIQPPLTEADERSLALQAVQNERRPEQHVAVVFDPAGRRFSSGTRPSPDAPSPAHPPRSPAGGARADGAAPQPGAAPARAPERKTVRRATARPAADDGASEVRAHELP